MPPTAGAGMQAGCGHLAADHLAANTAGAPKHGSTRSQDILRCLPSDLHKSQRHRISLDGLQRTKRATHLPTLYTHESLSPP